MGKHLAFARINIFKKLNVVKFWHKFSYNDVNELLSLAPVQI